MCGHPSEPSEGWGPASRSASSSRSSGRTCPPREPSQLAGRKRPSESAYLVRVRVRVRARVRMRVRVEVRVRVKVRVRALRERVRDGATDDERDPCGAEG